MGIESGISWCTSTWNVVVGCSILSPGCINCYAMKQAHELGIRTPGKYTGLTTVVNGKAVWNGTVRIHEKSLKLPFKWKDSKLIFVNSMSDLFHESLSDSEIFPIIDIMVAANWHKYQVLTKRTKRMADCLDRYVNERGSKLPDHILWGTTVEDQTRAIERIPILAAIPAKYRFVSAEPLLGSLDLTDMPAIEWYIVGGESAGKNGKSTDVRPFDVKWALDIASYCDGKHAAFHMKQLGSNPVGIKVTHYKGANMDEWPDEIKRQEYPF